MIEETDDANPSDHLEEVLRELERGLARVGDRLTLLEVRGTDPSDLLEEIDRKVEKLLDVGHVPGLNGGANYALSEVHVELDEMRSQICELRTNVDRLTKLLLG